MQPLVSPGAGPIPGVPSTHPTNLFRFGGITLYSAFAFPAGTALANSKTVSSRRLWALKARVSLEH